MKKNKFKKSLFAILAAISCLTTPLVFAQDSANMNADITVTSDKCNVSITGMVGAASFMHIYEYNSDQSFGENGKVTVSPGGHGFTVSSESASPGCIIQPFKVTANSALASGIMGSQLGHGISTGMGGWFFTNLYYANVTSTDEDGVATLEQPELIYQSGQYSTDGDYTVTRGVTARIPAGVPQNVRYVNPSNVNNVVNRDDTTFSDDVMLSVPISSQCNSTVGNSTKGLCQTLFPVRLGTSNKTNTLRITPPSDAAAVFVAVGSFIGSGPYSATTKKLDPLSAIDGTLSASTTFFVSLI